MARQRRGESAAAPMQISIYGVPYRECEALSELSPVRCTMRSYGLSYRGGRSGQRLIASVFNTDGSDIKLGKSLPMDARLRWLCEQHTATQERSAVDPMICRQPSL